MNVDQKTQISKIKKLLKTQVAGGCFQNLVQRFSKYVPSGFRVT